MRCIKRLMQIVIAHLVILAFITFLKKMYFKQEFSLYVRIYNPKTADKERQVDAALNDPKIGGMYDRGGGYLFTDLSKEAVFLVKDYSMLTVVPVDFINDVDNLNGLSGIWLMSWMGHVADQTFGAEPLPTQHITRENDPYRR